MAMNKRVLGVAAAAMLTLIQVATAANYTVGGTTGSWDSTTDLKTWSSSQKFQVGDNLLFQYGASHNLMEVSKADYDSCQASNAVQSYSDGNTVITLSSPGKRYFICGMPGHCLQGMKVEIDTLATASSSSPSPSPSSAAPAPTAASQAPAVPKVASSPSPLTSPTLSPATSTLPSDAPSAESPEPSTTTTKSIIPPQPSPSASSASRGSFSTLSLSFGFILIALVLMKFN